MTMYATLEQVKSALGETEFVHDDRILLSIESASLAIDHYCGRSFGNGGSGTRVFTAESRQVLLVDDLQVLTTLSVDTNGDGVYETTIPSTHIQLPGSAPYDAIRIGWPYYYPRYLNGVQVIGTWGYTEVPADIIKYTILFSQQLFLRESAPFGVIGGVDGTQVRVPKEDPYTKMLLDPYKRQGRDLVLW